MIHISDIAKRIKTFLEDKGEKQFKIYIRINFQIDVFVATSRIEEAMDYEKEFFKTLRVEDATPIMSVENGDNSSNMDYPDAKDYRIKFIIVSEKDAQEDPYYSNIFTANSEVIDWGPRYRFDSLLDNHALIANNTSISKAPVVTFYSYKGGMGRTTTMVAYALHLAVNDDDYKKKRVVIIDCDLEAPGYLNFFDLEEHKGLKSGRKNGLVEFFCDAQLKKKPETLNLDDYIINVGKENDNQFANENLENIWIVPAGNLNEGYRDSSYGGDTDRYDYLEGLAKINISNIQNLVNCFSLLFNKINEDIKPDVILLDSRTGFNDIFGTAALFLSSCVVGFFGFSRQTEPGLINLLKEYYKKRNRFNLQLVFSILPEHVEEEWLETKTKRIREFIDDIGNEEKDYPSFSYIRRMNMLERVGEGDDRSDVAFVDLVKNRQNPDYNELFDKIDQQIFPIQENDSIVEEESIESSSTNQIDTTSSKLINEPYSYGTTSLQLRNVILRHLQRVLANVKNFAEETDIVEEQFYYRECMKQLYDVKKFIIRGYKGTGKTYLYRALTNSVISENIQKWGGIEEEHTKDTIFINVLPPTDTELVFENILYSQIEEPEYYFNVFWQIYTWNALLLDPEFESVKNESELKEYVLPLSGYGNTKTAYLRIDTLIKQNIRTQIIIEKDIIRLNQYLNQNNKTLFVLYDRLDTGINPLHWNKAVSPLINYWRNNYESFSNIVPKIFVRTDLFKQIEGTNTARLGNNIIEIEWTIGEVFGYFFKLIFSDKKASEAYWTIAQKIGINESYIKNTKNAFERFPMNQFKSMQIGEMKPIISAFFGNQVRVGDTYLGSPWEYFKKELANADNSAISLRPFINTLDGNAVVEALKKTDPHVKVIISPSIYASKEVREKTTEQYFNDLARDAFSKDLLRFKEVIRSSGGEKFRYKALNESLFEELINTTYKRIVDIGDSKVTKTPGDLKNLIFANGIMAEKITTKGRFYRFAPIYWYSWGLANSILEYEELRRIRRNGGSNLVVGKIYEGEIGINDKGNKCVFFNESPYQLVIRDKRASTFEVGTKVLFTVRSEPNYYDPNEPFYYAIRIQQQN